jgi:hypothetical protein
MLSTTTQGARFSIRGKTVLGICVVIFLQILTGTRTKAGQSQVPDSQVQNLDAVDSEIQGVRLFRAIPKDFNAEGATASELARHGLPPKPDKQRLSTAYRAWQQLVESASYRVIPKLERSDIYFGTVKGWKKSSGGPKKLAAGFPGAATSDNWSGFLIDDTTNIFAHGVWLTGSYTVPAVADCLKLIPNIRTWSANWIGVDGDFGSNDVFQIGTSSDNLCNETFGGGPHAAYYAWFEWFPNPSYIIKEFGVIPGDYVVLTAVVTQNPTQYTLTYDNRTRRRSVVISPPPPGVPFLGNCIEWILERPSIGNQLTTLAPYLKSGWRDMFAMLPNSNVYMPSSAPTGDSYLIQMVNPADGSILSAPSLFADTNPTPLNPTYDAAWFEYVAP